MKPLNIREAKTHLLRLVEAIREGSVGEVVITVAGKPTARIIRYVTSSKRPLGIDEGLVWVSEDFDADSEQITRSPQMRNDQCQ